MHYAHHIDPSPGFSIKLDKVVENHSEEAKNHPEGTKFPLMWYFEHHSEDFFWGEPWKSNMDS